ncbi:sulfatase [Catenovulum agarivorans]|nr:sulfatase [Catenovulum agarivorans]
MISLVIFYCITSVKAYANKLDGEQPNILFIMVDDLGWQDIGAYGKRDIDTPNLDKLANSGMLFTHAYASAPVCSPSRAGAITGQHPARIGLTNHISHEVFTPDSATLLDAPTLTALPESAITFAEVLRDHGYRTGFFGKWHLSLMGKKNFEVDDPSTLPDNQGFEINVGGGAFGGPPSWFSPYKNPYMSDGENGEYLPTRLANEVINFMADDSQKPFLAVMWNYLVHSPLKTTEALTKKYQQRAKEGKNVGLPVFAGMIEAMDTSVGKVLQAVDDLGLANDTLIIFTSDNGGVWKLSDNGELQYGKGFPYEGGVRVPFIAKWPGKIKENVVNQNRIINTDLFPTFLSAAGINPNSFSNIDGESLLPVLTETKNLNRQAIYFHYPNYAWHKNNRLGGAIIQGAYKLINWYDDDSVELYNLYVDPSESEDLSKIHPDITQSLKTKFKKWLKETNAQMPIRIISS